MKLREVKKLIIEILEKADISDSEFDATEIISAVAGVSRTDFILNQKEIDEKTLETIKDFANRRAAGEPLQYILGSWEFYSLPFIVGEGVLIPRADTEILVDAALEFIGNRKNLDIIDLCSGSGCIAISIDKNAPENNIFALEKYDEALGYLKKKKELNNSDIEIIKVDIFEGSDKKFHLILSNPPYIKAEVCKTLSKEVLKEPQAALDGGEDGLKFYRANLDIWAPLLKSDGALMVEIGYDQKDEVMNLFQKANLKNITCLKDFNGNHRVIVGTVNH